MGESWIGEAGKEDLIGAINAGLIKMIGHSDVFLAGLLILEFGFQTPLYQLFNIEEIITGFSDATNYISLF